MNVEQAIYGSQDAGGYRFLARSPGFLEEWLPEAERLCTGFGERPAGISCPGAVFVQPFGRRHVAVVQVADQGLDDAGRPGALAFHLLVLLRSFYLELQGDPFHFAEQFSPPWQARGELPSLVRQITPPPTRTVALMQKTLNVPHSATLLGGAQALLDGGRLVFERSQPDAAILRSLWALLPTRERCELWPATFVFSNVHQFDVLVVPRATGPEYEPYITEEKAGDYPEGRYECNLQSAIETGDQKEIDALLSYNRSHMLRLTVVLLVTVIVLSLAMARLLPGPSVAPSVATAKAQARELDLPRVEECPRLSEPERRELTERLQQLGERLHVKLPMGDSEETLKASIGDLDAHLGTPNTQRKTGSLATFGPVQRQLRVLLWKHGVDEYNARGLNTVELLERLEQRLEKKEPQRFSGADRGK